ncbi:MAG: 1-deoxy-D-xylulose-5-phosphate reductoisomerase [Coriobacteriaceae bacterium]|nr:1-deoxy-D-xylulose-5-phosphate reductoisomerase [Coriobacteriaceae bacterium]
MNVVILGSTGSIGTQALDVARRHPDELRIVGLAAHSSSEMLVQQAQEFRVKRLALGNEGLRDSATLAQLPHDARVDFGLEAIEELCEIEGADMVLNALSGAVGLRASYRTLISKKKLALANKESLVVGGDLLMPLADSDSLLPVDSEHSAIFQCLLGEDSKTVNRLWLTASGGPFRGRTREQLAYVTREQTLAHPTWKMGPKITVDSATLMNKGLEVIEAYHLFGLDYDRISVVVHPQSCIHSMVEYCDGSVKAHLGVTDMRIPIQLAFSYPQRWQAPIEPLDFTQLGTLSFEPADEQTFRALALAKEAGRQGGTMPAVLNAANEIAVQSFLNRICGFLDIERIVERVMLCHNPESVCSLEQLEQVDGWARATANDFLRAL